MHLPILKICALLACILAAGTVRAQYNYAEALQKTLFFYEAQRSGKMPPDNRVAWRGDSHLNDGRDVGIDLAGGWYDAGDSPKWNVTMAFAASTLAWSAVAYPEAYRRTGQMPHLLRNLKCVGDYFIKCLRFKTLGDLPTYRVFVEVGNAPEEHKFWAANEVMHLLHPKRPSFYADKEAPATSVVAAMAAAQAASSVVFRQNGNARYADALLRNARALYAFAEAYKGNGTIKNARGEKVKPTEFYDDDRYDDQLCWAALWLGRAAKAAGEAAPAGRYAEQARLLAPRFASRVPETTHWYSGYEVASYLLLAEDMADDKPYRAAIEAALLRLERLPASAGGLVKLNYEWGSLRHANNAAWLFFAYADRLPPGPDRQRYLRWAKGQLDYSLGSNPQNRSYLVGFQPAGKTVVNTPHHRTAHAPWAGWEHLNPERPEHRATPRHILYGGLLGGPNWQDEFKADAANAAQAEVALDFNAGITASLARMTAKTDAAPLAGFPPREKPDDEFFVEAAVAGQSERSLEIKARLNNRSAFPARATRNLAFRYYFQAAPGAKVTATLAAADPGAAVTQPVLHAGSTYYIVVSFPGTSIFPGGLDPARNWQPFYRKEATFRLESTAARNPANDWSLRGVAPAGKAPVKTARMSVWHEGRRLAGTDPPKAGS